LVAILFIIILVIIFGGVEVGKGGNFCNDRVFESAAFIQFCLVMFGFFLLFIIVILDYAAVLRAYVVSLPVKGGRVVCLPEYFQ
jgi:hypothetical protein